MPHQIGAQRRLRLRGIFSNCSWKWHGTEEFSLPVGSGWTGSARDDDAGAGAWHSVKNDRPADTARDGHSRACDVAEKNFQLRNARLKWTVLGMHARESTASPSRGLWSDACHAFENDGST